MTLLSAENIRVLDRGTTLVSDISLTLEPGEPLVILGETGSGKSLLAQAILGTLPDNLNAQGQVTLGQRVLDVARPSGFRPLWGRELAVLPQEPWLSLDPLMRATQQVTETHQLVRGLRASEAKRQAEADLAQLGLDGLARHYPHQLSGGMAQRVALAAARAGGARIVIADEPTKGLDAARRDDVAALLLAELNQGGGLLVITHDLALARMVGGRLVVMRDGAVVESGATRDVLASPQAAYTRELVAADPLQWPMREHSPGLGKPVVSAEGISLTRGGKPLFSDLTLGAETGRILGITGPSGCGKSSLGDVLIGLIPPDTGSIHRQQGLATTACQKLYQDPASAFPARRTLGTTLADVARLHKVPTARINEWLDRLRLDPVLLSRRPAAVSGGELQRLALLRAMLVQPRFLFADEPTSRLDPITQREVITLLSTIAAETEVAVVLVSHDEALIDRTADSVYAFGANTAMANSKRIRLAFMDNQCPTRA